MMPPRRASIEIAKEDLHFSAAHFTIFDAARRENLHGHNFFVEATIAGRVDGDGLVFDYGEVKSRLRALCGYLDETVLLAADSPHLAIDTGETHVAVRFGDERLLFLHRDVKLLPLRNVTVEELAHWFVAQLTADESFSTLPIDCLELRVSSGPGQWAGVAWTPPARKSE